MIFYRIMVSLTIGIAGICLGTSLSEFANHSHQKSSFLAHIALNINSNNSETPQSDPIYAVAVETPKVNSLYVGIENPITVVPNGKYSLEDLEENFEVEARGARLRKVHRVSYYVFPDYVGSVQIIIKNKKTGESVSKEFRAKRIPKPVVLLTNNKKNGEVRRGTMRVQRGLYARLDNFNFDAKCRVTSFKLFYEKANGDGIELNATSGRFTGKVLECIQSAEIGDQYFFTYVKARCPGDETDRKVNSLSFNIK